MTANPAVQPASQENGPLGMSAAAHWRRFRLLPTGVEVVGDPTFDEWQSAFTDLTRAQGSIHWWLGDMLAVGEARYGERYTQAVDATGYAVQTLMHMVFVASHVAPERRRPTLSFTHHKEVASLEPDDQEALLAEAEQRGWRSREMAEAVRAYKGALKPGKPDNLPAREDSATPAPQSESENRTTPAPIPAATEAAIEDLDLAVELERADEEISALQRVVDSLQTTDHGKEIAGWAFRYHQLEGRVQQLQTEANEAKRQAKYQGDLLKKIRGVLRVETNAAILPALMQRKAA